MRISSRRVAGKRQRGSAAVEAALIIPLILVPLFAFILLFGRYFWYYTVAQKTAHDAALYLASAPLADIRSNNASDLAKRIIEWETADLDPVTLSNPPSIECRFRVPAHLPPPKSSIQTFPCSSTNNNAKLAFVRVSLYMPVSDPFLSPLTAAAVGSNGLSILAAAEMGYVAR